MSQAMNTLTQKESEALRRWVTKINHNTWEIREHPYQRVLVAFFLACWFIGALTIVPIMQSDSGNKFEHRTWHSGWDSVIKNIEWSFMPRKVMEENFLRHQDKRNLGFTRGGEAREEYIEGMLEFHKAGIQRSRCVFAFFAFWIGYLFVPTKRRLRIDRKRRLAYLYVGRKFYITELDKLTDSLANYFTTSDMAGVHNYLSVGVHPSRYGKGENKSALFRVTPFYTFYVGISSRILLLHKNTREEYVYMQSALPNSILPRALIDFVNPDTPAEKLAEYDRVITGRRTWKARLYDWAFGWLSAGLFCRPFPSKKRLQRDLDRYFNEVAPTIDTLHIDAHTKYRTRNPARIGYRKYQTVSRRTVYNDVLAVLWRLANNPLRR